MRFHCGNGLALVRDLEGTRLALTVYSIKITRFKITNCSAFFFLMNCNACFFSNETATRFFF